MGFFSDNLGLSISDAIDMIPLISSTATRRIAGYNGCHYIMDLGCAELILDCRYSRNGAEEIAGVSSYIATDAESVFMSSQYIICNAPNKMEYFAKVNAIHQSEVFPVSFVNGEILPSYAFGSIFSARYEGFALDSEFFSDYHEALLHAKLDPECYGPIDKISNTFYAPADKNGVFRSLAVKALLKVYEIKTLTVVYSSSSKKIAYIDAALCRSPLGGKMLVILTGDSAKRYKGKKLPQDLQLWTNMIISLDPAVGARSDGAVFDERNLIALLTSSIILGDPARLDYALHDEAELFSGDVHLKGKASVIEYLGKSKGPHSPAAEYYKPMLLEQDIDGVEKGHPAFAINSYEDGKTKGIGFISVADEKIDRIMFRYFPDES